MCKDVTANTNRILSQTSNTAALLQDSSTYTSRSSRLLEETIIGRWGLETSTFGWAFLLPYTRATRRHCRTCLPACSSAKSDPAINHRARRKSCSVPSHGNKGWWPWVYEARRKHAQRCRTIHHRRFGDLDVDLERTLTGPSAPMRQGHESTVRRIAAAA
jgi:hypothetical protein